MKDQKGKKITPKEFMEKDIRVELPKLRKGQKCFHCKKEIKNGIWIYNGFYWHEKCKDADTYLRIRNYLKTIN